VKAHGKSSARVMALQALYQQYITGEIEDNDSEALAEKISRLYKNNKDLQLPAEADQKLLKALIEGCLKNREALDEIITARLTSGWDIERLGPTLRAILRLGIYEMNFTETPVKVIIKEYIRLADEFVGVKEAKFVNGILDKIARDTRKDG